MGIAWFYLALAVGAEILAALAMRFSEGFTKPLFVVLTFLSFWLSLYLGSLALLDLPISIVYPIWAGGGTAGVGLVGILALKESAGATKILAIGLVVAGTVILNISTTG